MADGGDCPHRTPLRVAAWLAGAAALALHVLLHLALLGPLNPGFYLDLTLLSALPLLVWAPTAGVLAACGLRTRRRAIFMGVLVSTAGPLCWGLAFRWPATDTLREWPPS